MKKLRPPQREAVAAVEAAIDRGFTRNLVVFPTGGGKTPIAAEIVRRRFERLGKPELFVAHREELMAQGARTIQEWTGLSVGFEAGEQYASHSSEVVVASVQTLGRKGSERLAWLVPGGITIDEAHHSSASTWVSIPERFGAFEGRAELTGFTATPHRMDNKPLHGEGAVFEHVAYSYSLLDAVRDGWLVDLHGYRAAYKIGLDQIRILHGDFQVKQLSRAMNTPDVRLFALHKWLEVARDLKTMAFCVDVQHALDMASDFNTFGIAAAAVYGEMKPEVRRDVFQRFRMGHLQVLTSCTLTTEGFDDPGIGCVLLLRPTKSWTLFMQMIGRGSRPLPGTVDGLPIDEGEEAVELRRRRLNQSEKPHCLIVDIVDMTSKHSAVTLPQAVGLPPMADLDGTGILAASERIGRLDDFTRGRLFQREFNLKDIDEVLRRVDILAETRLPADVAGFTKLKWLKVDDDRYVLLCGNERTATLLVDTLGRCSLRLRTRGEVKECDLGNDLKAAFSKAESLLNVEIPGYRHLVDPRATWRSNPVTEGQRRLLKIHGYTDADIALVRTQGEATDLVNARQFGGHAL